MLVVSSCMFAITVLSAILVINFMIHSMFSSFLACFCVRPVVLMFRFRVAMHLFFCIYFDCLWTSLLSEPCN